MIDNAFQRKRRCHGRFRHHSLFLSLVFFIFCCFIEKHHVASLQLHGTLSVSSGPSLSSPTLRDCYSSIRSSTFLSSPVLLREVDVHDISESSLPSVFLSSRSSLITMNKGDGKQKRKKKDASSSTSSSSLPSPSSPPVQPTAPRVSTDINVPIRRQIQYGKLNKQYREQSGNTAFRQNKKFTRSKYRRSWGTFLLHYNAGMSQQALTLSLCSRRRRN
jgi:hypothetical protein